MIPALRHGDIVFGIKTKKYKVGNCVIATIEGREVVKRTVRVDQSGLWLQGDNALYSADSRQYGTVSTQRVLARVIFVYSHRIQLRFMR